MSTEADALKEVEGCCGSRGGGRYVILRLSVRGDTITSCSFESNGCPAAHLAVGGLATFLKNRKLEQAARLEPQDLLLLIGGLPDGKGYYADMAVEALKHALHSLQPITDYRSPITDPFQGSTLSA